MANWQRTPEAQALVDRVAAKVLSPEIKAYVQSVYPECDYSARAYKRLDPLVGFAATVPEPVSSETSNALLAMCGWGAHLDKWMRDHAKYNRMLDHADELQPSSGLFLEINDAVSAPDLTNHVADVIENPALLGVGAAAINAQQASIADMLQFGHLDRTLALIQGVFLDLTAVPANPVTKGPGVLDPAAGNQVGVVLAGEAFFDAGNNGGAIVFGEPNSTDIRDAVVGAAVNLQNTRTETELLAALNKTGRKRDSYIGKLLTAVKQTGVRGELYRMYNELSQKFLAKASGYMGVGASTFARGIRQAYPQCAPGMEMKLFNHKGFPAKQGEPFDPARTMCVPAAIGGGMFAARKYHRGRAVHHALPKRNAKGRFVKSGHRAPAVKRAPAHRRYRASVVADPAFDWKPASSLSVPKRLPFNAAAQLFKPRVNYRAMSLAKRPYRAMMLDRPAMPAPLKSMLLKADQARKCHRCYRAVTRAQAKAIVPLHHSRKPASRKPASRKPASRKPASRKPASHRMSPRNGARRAGQKPIMHRRKKWAIGDVKIICGKKYKLGYSKKVGPNGKRARVWHVLHPKKVQKRKLGDKKMICGKMRVLGVARKPKRALKPGEHRRRVWHILDKKHKK